MPNFHYTIHAHTAMNEREILHEWVEETLENPEHCAEDPKDSDLRRFYRHIPDFENRVLRVVANIMLCLGVWSAYFLTEK